MASHEAFAVPILVTCLAVWQAVYFANIVSRWRGKLKIKAPLVTGELGLGLAAAGRSCS